MKSIKQLEKEASAITKKRKEIQEKSLELSSVDTELYSMLTAVQNKISEQRYKDSLGKIKAGQWYRSRAIALWIKIIKVVSGRAIDTMIVNLQNELPIFEHACINIAQLSGMELVKDAPHDDIIKKMKELV